MPELVKVDDVAVFTQFRMAVMKFYQAASSALANADSSISRTQSWLESEQTTYWSAQLRKRSEAVTQAREAVRQKKLYKDASGRMPGAVEEEKILARCIAAVEEAQQKIASIKRWIPRLSKEADNYRSGVARLNRCLTDEVPRAVALLDRLAIDLEQYLHIESPSGEVGDPTADPALYADSMARAADVAPPPSTPAPAPAQPAATETPTPETPHVPHGL